MKDRFHNASGTLTQYAFMCGYQELHDTGDKWVRLYAEGDCYHVRAHDFSQHERIAWDTFTSLTEARKRYRELLLHIGA